MKHYISLLMLATAMGCQAQTFTIQTSTPRQTIQHFGASDAWSMQFIGLWDNEAEQQKIADWLFLPRTMLRDSPVVSVFRCGVSIWVRAVPNRAMLRRLILVHVRSVS